MSELDKMIANLSKQATPVKPMPHPFVSFLKWILGVGCYVTVLIVCTGIRDDISLKLHSPLFLAEIGALLAMIFASALSISVLSFPDLHQKRWAAYLPLVTLLLLCLVLTLEWFEDSPPSPKPDHNGLDCLRCILFSAIIPASWIFYRLRKMATTHPLLAGGVALLGAAGIGCLALRISEETDSITHLLQWHYIPMLLLAALGLWLGKKFLKW